MRRNCLEPEAVKVFPASPRSLSKVALWQHAKNNVVPGKFGVPGMHNFVIHRERKRTTEACCFEQFREFRRQAN